MVRNSKGTCLAICMLAPSLLSCSEAQSQWTNPLPLFEAVVGTNASPRVDVGEGQTYVVMYQLAQRSANAAFLPTDIYFTQQNGQVWQSPTNLSNDEAFSTNPTLVAGSGGAVHVLWGGRPYDPSTDQAEAFSATELVYSVYDGTTWSSPEAVFYAGSTRVEGQDVVVQHELLLPASAAVDDEGTLHVVFEESVEHRGLTYLRRKGGTWLEERSLGLPLGTGEPPRVFRRPG